MKNLKTFESAAQFLGIDPNKLPEVSMLPEKHQGAVVAFYKLTIISEAAWKQEGKVIDWHDWNQYKYFPWFDMSPKDKSSRGFSYCGYSYDNPGSSIASRLVFPTQEIAEYVGNTHIDFYRDYMVID